MHHRVIRSSEFMRQTAPFSGANIGVYWLRAHVLGAERGIEVNISNETFVYKSNVHLNKLKKIAIEILLIYTQTTATCNALVYLDYSSLCNQTPRHTVAVVNCVYIYINTNDIADDTVIHSVLVSKVIPSVIILTLSF